jgi:DNA-3-methyladenine glycosylase I
MMAERRCPWGKDALLLKYHDEEWGVPSHDDRLLYEHLMLDCAQAGLSWLTILRKREAYRRAFDGFDPVKVAAYDEGKVAELLRDTGIVRNRAKVNAFITNAKAFLQVQEEFGSFDKYIWSFVGGGTIQSNLSDVSRAPTETEESRKMSVDLRARGFKFVGPTICYAFMQAVGMVNDHVADCYRHKELGGE